MKLTFDFSSITDTTEMVVRRSDGRKFCWTPADGKVRASGASNGVFAAIDCKTQDDVRRALRRV